jgi:prevent-host-death family protein
VEERPVPRINVAEDIVPIGEFKTHASSLLRRLHANRRPLVITQNGRPAAVVLTPEEFEQLAHRELVRSKIRAGVKGEGRAVSSDEARRRGKIRAAARR